MKKLTLLLSLILTLALVGQGWCDFIHNNGITPTPGLSPGGGGINWNQYLTADLFLDTKAAGSVNGSKTIFYGLTRWAVDSGSGSPFLSIGSGKVYATGGSGGGSVNNPAMIYPYAISTRPGRIIGTKFNVVTASANGPALATSSSSSSWSYRQRIYFDQYHNIQISESNAPVTSCEPYKGFTIGWDYSIAINDMGTGSYYFGKGGDLQNWTLFYRSPSMAGTYYPGISTGNASFYGSYFYVANPAWEPAPTIYDGWTHTGSLASYTTSGYGGDSGLGVGGSGLTWQIVDTGTGTPAPGISESSSTHTISATSLDSTGRAIAIIPINTRETYVQAQSYTKGTTGAGIILRYYDKHNYIYLWHDGTHLQFVKRLADVETTTTLTAAYSAGVPLEMTADGWLFNLYYNSGVSGASNQQSINNNIFQVANAVGVIFFDTNSTIGIFTTYPIGSIESTYNSIFDKYIPGSYVRDSQLYKFSVISGGLSPTNPVTFSGAPDNYTLPASTFVVDGNQVSWPGGSGVKALITISGTGHSMKDPMVYYEAGTYYCFTDYQNGSNFDIRCFTCTGDPEVPANWIDQGTVYTFADFTTHVWDTSNNFSEGVWEPAVVKVGSTYYMSVCGFDKNSVATCAYLSSSNLLSEWTFQDTLRDNTGTTLYNVIDPTFFIDNGTPYLIHQHNPGSMPYNFVLRSGTPSANRWTSISSDVLPSATGKTEAPRVYNDGGQYKLMFGSGNSITDQRICLAVSNTLAGPYNMAGITTSPTYGTPYSYIYLPSPENDTDGPINTPAAFWNYTQNRWDMMAGTGTKTGGNSNQDLTVYKMGKDWASWDAAATSPQLFTSATVYLWMSPTGTLYHSAIKPCFTEEATAFLNKGWLYLGTLTTDSSRDVTGYSPN